MNNNEVVEKQVDQDKKFLQQLIVSMLHNYPEEQQTKTCIEYVSILLRLLQDGSCCLQWDDVDMLQEHFSNTLVQYDMKIKTKVVDGECTCFKFKKK